jgi:AAHS family 4-hydroxybenzoate transporter-like MFS transporter
MGAQPPGEASDTVDIAQVIEARGFDRFALKMLLLSLLVTFFDGFDLTAISFAAPYLAPDLGLDEITLGYVFSIGLAGMMLGALAAGMVADRFGRRPVIVGTTFVFGLLTLAMAWVRSVELLLVVRFLQGFALAGVIPLCWALNVDYAPARRRATVVTLVTMGFGLGNAAAGPASVWLIPRFGWESLFLFGGGAAILCSLLLLVGLPESLRFLITRQKPRGEIAAAFRRFAPEIPLPPEPRFIASDEAEQAALPAGSVKRLFEGRFLLITPLIWLSYLASSMMVYLLATWGPLIFEAMGFSRANAAYIASFNGITGAIGGLALMRFTDRKGIGSVAVLPLIAIPMMLAIGLFALPYGLFLGLNLALGLFLVGGHYGVMSIMGTAYPSAIRATGAGWASSVGRIGAIAGPLIGGVLMASTLPPRAAFAVISICPMVVVVCILLMLRVDRREATEGATCSAAPHNR